MQLSILFRILTCCVGCAVLILGLSFSHAQTSTDHPGKKYGLSDEEILDTLQELFSDCDNGDATNCSLAGLELLNGQPPIAKDIPRGIALTKKACELGHAAACWRGSTLLLDGTKEYDIGEFEYYLEKLCELDDIDGCISVAGFYYKGKGPEGVAFPQDFAKSLYYSTRVCELDDSPYKRAKFCTEVGSNYEYGVGTAEDFVMARKYYSLGCKRGHKAACDYLSYLQ